MCTVFETVAIILVPLATVDQYCRVRATTLQLPPTESEIERLASLTQAVARSDRPGELVAPASFIRALLTPTASTLTKAWVIEASWGELVGSVVGELPLRDNTHLGWLEIGVHPDHRRQGIGQELLRVAFEFARNEARRELVTHTIAGSAGDGLASRLGALITSTAGEGELARPAQASRRWEELARKAADVAEPAGFCVKTISGPCPAGLVEDLARARSGMNDAPVGGLDLKPHTTEADEIREAETLYARAGIDLYRVLALAASGEVAGYSELLVGRDDPSLGIQEDTTVLAPYRGNRLGLWMKAAMLAWLASAEPDLAVVRTFNDVTNTYMLAVNDALGFSRVREWNTQALTI